MDVRLSHLIKVYVMLCLCYVILTKWYILQQVLLQVNRKRFL